MPGLRSDGREVLLEISFAESPLADQHVFTAVVRDVTERRRAEAALRESEERFRSIAESVSEAFWLHEPDGRVAYMSPASVHIWGIGADAACGPLDRLLDQVVPAERPAAAALWSAAAGGAPMHGEFRVRTAGGDDRWLHVRLFPAGASDTPGREVGTAADITARRRAEEQLVHDAFHDVLTRLPNRALFLDRLHHTLERCRREPDDRFAVLLVDLDHFKLINDGLGHLAGDAALVAVAHRLKDCIRAGDTVARLGGDEFALLLEQVDRPEDAIRVADRVAAALSTPLEVDGNELFTTASIGIAIGPAEHTAPGEVLRSADTALYQAKDRGRAGYALFDQEMHAASVARLRLETDLRRAVERDEFITHFQPIVELASGRVNGFEALVRWQHPDRGCLLPAEFLAVADDRGLMSAIGERVLRDACAHAARCRLQGSQPTVAVNLSAKQLLQPDLVTRVDAALAEYGLPGEALVVELTEGALGEGAETAAVLAALRKRGIRLYIDDFGTGYSSLARLHQLPIDALKIDRSFLSDGGGSPEIVRAVVTLAHALGLAVVAEGVETPQQRDALIALGCDAAQGFFFARPAEPHRAAALLAV
jgi:diguanylate cyclase (GGDEF)-like protein/PAS domain S-box-containing protein